MKKYIVKNLGSGWYDFSKLPQDKCYIKISALKCNTPEKANKQAMHILEVNNILNENSKDNIEILIK